MFGCDDGPKWFVDEVCVKKDSMGFPSFLLLSASREHVGHKETKMVRVPFARTDVTEFADKLQSVSGFFRDLGRENGAES